MPTAAGERVKLAADRARRSAPRSAPARPTPRRTRACSRRSASKTRSIRRRRRRSAAASSGPALRVVAWNVERCKHLEASAALLAALDCRRRCCSPRLDWGMARSGQRHTARELAARLGMSYAYGVEYLELDSAAASARFAGAANEVGYHGNAILARGALLRPQLVRLDARGDWFDGARGERRVGGRCAVLAQVEVAGRPITFAAVHLDSHGSPRRPRRRDARAARRDRRLRPRRAGRDRRRPERVLARRSPRSATPERVAAALRDDPAALVEPGPARAALRGRRPRGYDWSAATRPAFRRFATRPTPDRARRDEARLVPVPRSTPMEPRVVDAVGSDGPTLSDHEAIAATFGL